MKTLLWSVVKGHFRSAKKERGFWAGAGLMLLLSVILTAYGLGLGWILAEDDLPEKGKIWLIKGLSASLIFTILSADYFPNFRMKNRVLPGWWPVSKTRAWVLELFFELTRPLVLQFCISVFATLIYAPYAFYDDLIFTLFPVFGIVLTSDLLRLQLRYTFDRKRLNMAATILQIPLWLGAVALPQPWNFIAGSILLMVGIGFSSYLYHQKVLVQEHKMLSTESGSGYKLALRFIWQTKVFRNTLVLALLLKGMIPLYLKFFVLRNNVPDAFGWFFWAALFSPFTIFSYIGGNFWGAAVAVWYRLKLSGSGALSFLQFQVWALGLFVLVDFILSMSAAAALGKFDANAVNIYASMTVSMLLLSQWFSHWFPRKVSQTFQLRSNNVHPGFTLAVAGTGMLTYFSAVYLYAALAWFLPVLMLVVLFFDSPYATESGRKWSHQYYATLNKPV